MKLSLFTFEFTPEELKNLDLDKYMKQALIDGTKESKDEPEIISKDNSTKLDTKDLLPAKPQDNTGSDFAELIANKLEEYAKDKISDTDSKPCFTDLFNSSTDSEQDSENNEVPSDMECMEDMKKMDDIIKQISDQLMNYKIGGDSDEDDTDDEQE